MKNKKILFVVIAIVVILIIAGLLGVLYAKTDFFKSNKMLFYQYLSKTKIIESEATDIIESVSQTISNNNYSSTGNINCSLAINDNTTNINNIQNLFTIKYNSLENKNLNQSYKDYTITSNNQDLITLRYMKDGNVYALKADNIVTKYLAVENKNLKEFFTKLGVENVTNIPNSIPQINLKELLNIQPEILNNIKSTYLKVIDSKLTNNNFTKITNADETTTIELSLTEQEIMDITKLFLETLKNDDSTINIIIEKASIFGYELNIDSIKTTLQEKIDEITNKSYSTNETLKFSVTENGKDTIGLEITIIDNSQEINKQYTLKLDFSEKNRLIIYSDTQDGNKVKEIVTFGYEENKFEANIDIIKINQDNTETSIANIKYQVNNYNTENITQSLSLKFIYEENNLTMQMDLNDSTNIKQDIAIEKITNENALLLNNMSSNDLNDLIGRIILRLQYLYGEQIQNMNGIINRSGF